MAGRQSVPRNSDQFFDSLGQRGYYRQSHDTADLIFESFIADGRSANI